MIALDNLKSLIDGRFGGSQAAFARAIERSPAQVNQWLTGHRKLDVKGCRHIERMLGLPADWMIGLASCENGAATSNTAMQRPSHYANSDIAALVAAVERLSPEDARALLPVVTRIADSQLRSTARRRGIKIDMSPADTTASAPATDNQ